MKVLVDLDGTLTTETKWPEIGEPNLAIISDLKDLKRDGFEIVVFTTRTWWSEKEIMKWCVDVAGFVPDGILCGKPLGIIVDDLAVNPRHESVYARVKLLSRAFEEEWK